MKYALVACLALAACATPPPAEKPAAAAAPSGRDLADLSLAAMRLQAQIDSQPEEFRKRPRKKFIGSRPGEPRFVAYEEAWRLKVERAGAVHFPAERRGKSGEVRATVAVRADGSVESVELDRSSGDRVFDAAVVQIINQAAPFDPFPPEIARDTDLLVITRTWFFGPAAKP